MNPGPARTRLNRRGANTDAGMETRHMSQHREGLPFLRANAAILLLIAAGTVLALVGFIGGSGATPASTAATGGNDGPTASTAAVSGPTVDPTASTEPSAPPTAS